MKKIKLITVGLLALLTVQSLSVNANAKKHKTTNHVKVVYSKMQAKNKTVKLSASHAVYNKPTLLGKAKVVITFNQVRKLAAKTNFKVEKIAKVNNKSYYAYIVSSDHKKKGWIYAGKNNFSRDLKKLDRSAGIYAKDNSKQVVNVDKATTSTSTTTATSSYNDSTLTLSYRAGDLTKTIGDNVNNFVNVAEKLKQNSKYVAGRYKQQFENDAFDIFDFEKSLFAPNADFNIYVVANSDGTKDVYTFNKQLTNNSNANPRYFNQDGTTQKINAYDAARTPINIYYTKTTLKANNQLQITNQTTTTGSTPIIVQ